MPDANYKDTDQPVHMHHLVSIFITRRPHKTGFLVMLLIYHTNKQVFIGSGLYQHSEYFVIYTRLHEFFYFL